MNFPTVYQVHKIIELAELTYGHKDMRWARLPARFGTLPSITKSPFS
jgi:hypothetical protein